MSLLTPEHERRLRHLLGSWSLRARPEVKGQQSVLLRGNIDALNGALAASAVADRLAENVLDAIPLLTDMRQHLQRALRQGKTFTRHDITDLVNQIGEVIEVLEAK